ncbi:predicted protein, partial [Nematostella vectensis]
THPTLPRGLCIPLLYYYHPPHPPSGVMHTSAVLLSPTPPSLGGYAHLCCTTITHPTLPRGLCTPLLYYYHPPHPASGAMHTSALLLSPHPTLPRGYAHRCCTTITHPTLPRGYAHLCCTTITHPTLPRGLCIPLLYYYHPPHPPSGVMHT